MEYKMCKKSFHRQGRVLGKQRILEQKKMVKKFMEPVQKAVKLQKSSKDRNLKPTTKARV